MGTIKWLRILDPLRNVFEKFGVDYPVMRKILEIKLLMDGRRAPTLLQKSSKNADPATLSNQFIKSLWIYIVLSLVLVPFVAMKMNFMFQMSLVFGILMFMITTSMISDFSSVLLDVRDRNILFSKPVQRKAINMAKLLHVTIYLLLLTGSLTVLPLLVGLYRHGILFFLLFIVEIILMDVFIVVLTAALYWLVLRFFDGEKLKDIINYVQIGLTIAMTVGYQFISRLFNLMDVKVAFTAKWWELFIFPTWFASPFEWLLGEGGNTYVIIFSVLSVVGPLAALWIYSLLMPSFERNLQKLATHQARGKVNRLRLADRLSVLFCRGNIERLFFRFSWDMMGRERDFKLKVYPQLGFSLIFPFIFMFNILRSNSGFAGMREGRGYLFLYFCAMMIPTIVLMLRFSGSSKGAWIYQTIPLKNTAPIYKGAVKAMIARLFGPVFVFQSVVFLFIFGARIIPDLVVILLSVLLYTVISFMVLEKELPFSRPFQNTQSGNTFVFLGLMILLGAFAGAHLGFTFLAYGEYLWMLLLLVLNLIAWKLAFRKGSLNQLTYD
ncbi:hypothetical protein J23TS9_39940 [Paenibacillus sp. J23TS9]|uniref:hypothetical protein n=1 Tax=Paenibacillus sp. J23TS9 TaxID=2807193 RepID=UPI001B2EABEA|nr:hypothetical protein [Paenibacillus sp. J23TS9]GIP28864.1 hypothetical protein J23TS9_39940 [Paenibacillus sp. J23TS9]